MTEKKPFPLLQRKHTNSCERLSFSTLITTLKACGCFSCLMLTPLKPATEVPVFYSVDAVALAFQGWEITKNKKKLWAGRKFCSLFFVLSSSHAKGVGKREGSANSSSSEAPVPIPFRLLLTHCFVRVPSFSYT